MAATWIQSLASVAAVSLISLVGLVTLALDPSRVRRVAGALVSFAVGALLGDAFLHLMPEIFAGPATSALRPPLLVVGGMMLFFLVEKLLRHRHRALHRGGGEQMRRPELAAINVIGDGIHNFIDGVLIAASYLASPVLGASTTIAVLLHEVPQELGDFGVLVHSGLSVRRAILVNLASASVAVAGAVLTLLVGSSLGTTVSDLLLPVAAGGFIYIAAADLIPELQADRSLRGLLLQSTTMALGVGLMALLRLVD